MRAFQHFFALSVWCAVLSVSGPRAAYAAEVLPGPIPATLIRVVDGDTVEVRARIWLGQEVLVAVRLAGIDAAERRGKCSEERALAEAATDHLRVFEGSAISLHGVAPDKFGGRVQAHVRHLVAGDLSASLLNAGLARAYGGGRRGSWCSGVALID